MLKLTTEISQYNGNKLVQITYNGESIFYKGYAEIKAEDLQNIKDTSTKFLSMILGGRIPVSLYSDLMNMIDGLIVVADTIEEDTKVIENRIGCLDELLLTEDVMQYKDQLKELGYNYIGIEKADNKFCYIFTDWDVVDAFDELQIESNMYEYNKL